MTGLDKIIDRIISEASETAAGRRAEAEKQAESIINQARSDAENIQTSAKNKAQSETADLRARAASSADMYRKTKILEAKQNIIADVLDKAYETVVNMETGDYFDMLLGLLDAHVLPRDGKMYLSGADYARMPSDFAQRAGAIAESKGGSIEISVDDGNIENGFILVYGGIEENCTIGAVFEAKRDRLSDKAQKILFS